MIGSPIHFADCLIGSPVTPQSAGRRRKAFKLGKFLADANKLRRVRAGPLLALELLASGGNLVYLFVEQLTWCAHQCFAN